MIATHNVNVDGVWYMTGQEIPCQPVETEPAAEPAVEAVTTSEEVPAPVAAEKKPAPSRRKKAN